MAATVPESGGSIEVPHDLSELGDPGRLGDETLTEIAFESVSSSIDVSAGCVTSIEVFTVGAENQARLVELLEQATAAVIRQQPGFISANLHAGLDGTRVANYGQWASVDDLNAMFASPECRPYLDEVAAIAESQAYVYRVSSVTHR